MYKIKLIIALAIILVVACAAILPKPTEKEVAKGRILYKNLTLEELEQGRQIYINRCGSCHQLYVPSQVGRDVWHKQLDRMVTQFSKLDSVKAGLVRKYINVSLITDTSSNQK